MPPDSADYHRAADQLALWPARHAGEALTRHLAATIHTKNWQADGTGSIAGYGPRDFRIVLAQSGGASLLDASHSWGGVRVFDHAPQLAPALVQMIARDLGRALDPPPNLDGLVVQRDLMALRRDGADGEETWFFDRPTGRLSLAELGSIRARAVHVEYRHYTDDGRIGELFLRHDNGRYDMLLTFSD